jgi:type IV pilus assembly protein PilP
MKLSNYLASVVVASAALATVLAQTAGSGAASRTTTAATTASSATDTTASTGEKNVQQSLQEILEEPTGADTYRYDPQGRRDPFQSLIGPAPRLQNGTRPPGVPGFLIDEVRLQGILKTKQGLVALIMGPDNKGYLIRVGDKVLDGEVVRITPASIVFRQEVNDPTRIERFREVVKDLLIEPKK